VREGGVCAAVKNKLALLLVLLFARAYPTAWPTFAGDLLALLPLGDVHVDLFLRVCLTLDDEVVARTMHRTDAATAAATLLVRDRSPPPPLLTAPTLSLSLAPPHTDRPRRRVHVHGACA
jgi:hypothetical protein